MRNRIRWKPGLSGLLFLALVALVPVVQETAQAGTKTWNTTAGDWSNDGNWVGGHPVAGDDAIITNAGAAVRLTSSTVYINSLTNSQTLIFSNWNTTLSAINVTILSGGIVTVASAFTTNAGVMSNNVYIVCSNMTVATGGKIIADGKGYAGGAVGANGYGPGAGKSSGANPACGGGYGGFSANAFSPGTSVGSFPYGSADTPFQPGSGGGGGNNDAGSAGGGAIRIEANGFVTNNGTISANGLNGGGSSYGSGGGSGGGIYIRCLTFGGTGGVVSANGGNGPAVYSTPGGGGRIALNFTSSAQGAVPAVSFQTLPGRMGTVYVGDIGTIYFSATNLLSETLSSFSGQLIIPNFNAWSVNSLTVTNAWVRFPNDGFVLNVAQDLTVGSNGNFGIGGSTPIPAADIALSCTTSPPIMQVGGNLILTNGGCLSVYSAMTNAGPGTTNYGALVSVTGDVVVASGSWIYPQSHPTNGGSPYFQMKSLSIATNAGINADGRGFAGGKLSADNGYGPGRAVGGNWSSGAGYGGFGGSCYDSYQNRGLVYGSATAPVDPGSGSGGGNSAGLGGAGGGSVWMNVRNGVLLNGTLTANGLRAGSGGGIYITCNTFVGTNGLVSAAGGPARNTFYAGSGGGGRIAIVYTNTAAQNALPAPGVRYTAAPDMTIGVNAARGDIGTLYFPDQRFLSETLTNMNAQIFGVTSWSPGSLLLSNNWVRFSADGIRLSVTNDVRVDGASGLLEIGGSFVLSPNIMRRDPTYPSFLSFPVLCSTSPPILSVGGNLILTNGGSLGVYCAPTNLGAGTTNYGGLVSVAKDMVIGTNSWVYLQSHPTNGGSVTFMVNNLFMADSANAGFNANGRGYVGAFASHVGFGPGYGPGSGSGGGYGGYGGGSYYRTYGGATYGSSNTPVDPGSGGWAYQAAGGGNGGGSIRIIANRTLAANGSFLANTPNDGSGGGIYITCRTFTGTTNGLLNAKGGDAGNMNGLQGAGGGGRIAVWRVQESPPYLGSWTVTNGFGYASSGSPAWSNGVPGTIVWGLLPAPGTVFFGR